jgi:hypothetical protein
MPRIRRLSAKQTDRITLILGIVIVGAVAGCAFGLYVEYSNWEKGNLYWQNNPAGFGNPVLSQVVFGTLPVGILLGYTAFGLLVAVAILAFVTLKRRYSMASLRQGRY